MLELQRLMGFQVMLSTTLSTNCVDNIVGSVSWRGSVSDSEHVAILVRDPARGLAATAPGRARCGITVFRSDRRRLLPRAAATAWIEVLGIYVVESHLLADPFDCVAALGVSQFFNLLFQCFTLRKQGAVSSVRHVGRVFFYD